MTDLSREQRTQLEHVLPQLNGLLADLDEMGGLLRDLVSHIRGLIGVSDAGDASPAPRYPLNRDAALLWDQVRDHLAGRIKVGEFGGRLPKRWELAQEYGVSPETVGRALRPLVEQGLLVSVPGKGPHVKPAAPPQHEIRSLNPRRKGRL